MMKNNRVFFLTLPAAILLFCLGLFAAPQPSYAESYVSAYAGGVIPSDSDVAGNSGSGGKGEAIFDTGFGLGVKMGHWFTERNAPFFGLLVDLNAHFPKIDKLKDTTTRVDIEFDMKVLSATINALMRYPEGNLRPYAGIGAGLYYAKIEDGALPVSVAGMSAGSFASESDSVLGMQLLAGLDFVVSSNVSIFGEYRYVLANFEFGGNVGIDLDYRANEFFGGVTYSF